MPNYSLPIYDKCREWIRTARTNDMPWSAVYLCGRDNEAERDEFLAFQRRYAWWQISADEWIELVQLQEQAERDSQLRQRVRDDATIIGDGQDNDLHIPADPNSSWQLYKSRLVQNGFSEDAVTSIEIKTHKILKRMNRDDSDRPAVKGLVIGNVQSGKTANMAALMAMAADWGWNMFIILSGTIESLRRQTQKRLLSDLNTPGNVAWHGLEHLSPKTSLEQRVQHLSFDDRAKQRYFTVCLKNSTRLKNLIKWMHDDKHQMPHMRILVIDDEADQAGINTASIDANERKAVNKAIVQLVNGLKTDGKPDTARFCSVNYIGYTATPYANILNESSRESLYPSDFIATLDVSNQYFGPQRVFGSSGLDTDENHQNDGLSIVRTLKDTGNELDAIRAIQAGAKELPPKCLQEAIAWFLCCAASFRVWGLRKPVSMLVHTSQKQDHHQNIADSIQRWFSQNSVEDILSQCREVWENETNSFTKERFFFQFSDYGRSSDQVYDYPSFDELEQHLRVLAQSPKHIRLEEDAVLQYHDGVHLCIDNCRYSKISDEGDHIRLAYPDDDNMPDLAPAFIVVGGATLSRGLTIEGLVSTYFLRSASQADTLMQMGRWFGYRKKYELLPRIWMTEKCRRQFVFLSTLDLELRQEIKDMETLNKAPRDYAPRLRNSPMASFIRITAKNRMQSAIEAEFDYTGVVNQTVLFDNSKDVQQKNFELTLAFVDSLPPPRKDFNNPMVQDGNMLWTGIPFATLRDRLLKGFKFQKRSRSFADMDSLIEWIDKMTANGNLGPWNVRFAGSKSRKKFVCRHGEIGMVTRTRKTRTSVEGLIDIGALRDPRDLVADIDLDSIPENLANRIRNFVSSDARSIRLEANMPETPLLIIYCIDGDSKPSPSVKRAGTRNDLNAPCDLIGLCFCIPGGKPNANYATKLMIKLEKTDVMNSENDMEDTNEN